MKLTFIKFVFILVKDYSLCLDFIESWVQSSIMLFLSLSEYYYGVHVTEYPSSPARMLFIHLWKHLRALDMPNGNLLNQKNLPNGVQM